MKNLQKLRKQKRLTQIELAKLLNVTQASISDWERQRNLPHIEIIEKIAEFFEVTVDYLIGKEPESGLVYVHKDPALTDEEKHVLELYRNIIPESRDLTLSILEQMPKIKADNKQSKKDV